MKTLIIFIIISVPVIFYSWRPLIKLNTHGFFRFFSWECIAWLLASNYSFWFENLFSANQIISWLLLFASIYVVLAGVNMLKKAGKASVERQDKELYAFEKTTELVDTGIYKYIRHPLYSSLLLLTWGIYFKNTSLTLILVSIISSICLYYTARIEEDENTAFFGDKYLEYMKRSKMFIPFIW
jgi:protein-S-isoprenylcysteine O-methyltransferase Ste14